MRQRVRQGACSMRLLRSRGVQVCPAGSTIGAMFVSALEARGSETRGVLQVA